MANMKNKFIEWMQSAQRKNGDPYSKETINNYVKALEGYTTKLSGLPLMHLDLFEIDTAKDFDDARSMIISHKDYEQINMSYHRIFSSALQIYSSFLRDICGKIPTSNYEDFSNWLTNYADHKYRDSTIKRYLIALDKAEERLEIKLSIKIWCIQNLNEYQTVYQEITSAEQYEFVNKKYGNGDLSAALGAYKKFIIEQSSNKVDWWPSLAEYTPGFTKDQWLKILSDPEIVGPVWGAVLAMFHTEPNGATCKMIAERFNDSPYSISGKCTQLAKKIHLKTNCPLFNNPHKDQEAQSYWPILFLGRDAKGDMAGTWIWKLRSELFEALTELEIEKYLPKGIATGKFDSWEIIDENTAIKHCDKSFFDYRGSGVPKGICWFFGADDMEISETKIIKLIYNGAQYQGSIKNESSDRRRVRIFWSPELGNLFNGYNVPNAMATFKKIADDTYEVSIEGGEKEMTIKEKIAAIKTYIAARGFNYEGDLIENFYLSLKSKPFVILAGTSGTGKTRLVKLFAEAIGAKMQLVPVRPDWSDSSDLFGHNDLSGQFHPGAIIDFVKQAEWDKDTPYFLCLDEMNLARVEYYLSDFLSIIETRDRKDNGAIETDALVDASYFQSQSAREKYGRVYLPENLYIIGTVNMDETTFPFSKKVLDRANTIEFSFVNLMSRATAGGQAVAQKLNNSFLKTDYLYLQDCDEEDLIDTICFNLEELNQILVKANLHVGYRVRDEISFYMMNNKKADLLNEDTAFDHEIMQKILPRVQGSSAAIKDVLSELFTKCAGDYTGFAGAAAYEQMIAYLDSKSCKYPNSAKKIAFMMRRYEEDGFTSYWL